MTTTTEIDEVEIERVDDIPVVFGILQKMRIQAIVDYVIKPHGNWQGISPGWLITIWLIHILTQHSHRMDRVQEWAAKRLTLLQKLTGLTLTELDFTDDRLALCLQMLSWSPAWQTIETQLGIHLVRAYRLGGTPTVRLDATVGGVYHDADEHSLFKLGKSKEGDYAVQFKLMLASLDPLGLTLAVDVVSGERADDPLYTPIYQRIKQILTDPGVLVVGDSKMSAIDTRGVIVNGGDYYLTPLAYRKDDPQLLTTLLTPWIGREAELKAIFLPEDIQEDGSLPSPELAVAYGFETSRTCQTSVDDETVQWTERLLVVRSIQFAESENKSLHRRLDKAEKALNALTPPRGRGKRQFEDKASLAAAIKRIETKYQVAGFFTYSYQKEVKERKIRAYKGKPARKERTVRFQLTVSRQEQAIADAEFQAGWRIYATNAPAEQFSLSQAVLAYRDQYIVENVFRRLKSKILSITPIYVHRDDHALGLFHLLTLAARVLALGDYSAKQALAQENSELAGIYPGNPKRSTPTPTTERMLAAFDNINLVSVSIAGHMYYQITPLTDVQTRILQLLDLPVSLFTPPSANNPGE